jgi:hypothetical protein
MEMFNETRLLVQFSECWGNSDHGLHLLDLPSLLFDFGISI